MSMKPLCAFTLIRVTKQQFATDCVHVNCTLSMRAPLVSYLLRWEQIICIIVNMTLLFSQRKYDAII